MSRQRDRQTGPAGRQTHGHTHTLIGDTRRETNIFAIEKLKSNNMKVTEETWIHFNQIYLKKSISHNMYLHVFLFNKHPPPILPLPKDMLRMRTRFVGGSVLGWKEDISREIKIWTQNR